MNLTRTRFLSAFLILLSLVGNLSSQAYAVVQLAELTERNGAKNEFFGGAVAISGNILAVGAPDVIENGRIFGAVYVFENDGAGWTQVAKLTEIAKSGLGASVAISGDGRTIVAGAAPAGEGGAVFVFVEPASGWTDMTQTAQLSVHEQIVEQFGLAVAVNADGRIIAVGSKGSGAAIYEEPASGWTGTIDPTAILAMPEGAERFGSSIAISGNTVAVGDPFYLDPRSQPTGGVFVYVLRPGPHTLPISAILTASDAAENDQLGGAVGISGNIIVAGANGHNSLAGAVYVFVKPSGGWEDGRQTAELTLSRPVEASLGFSVAISGDAIIAGAPAVSIGRNAIQGGAVAYVKPADGWVNSSTPNVSVTGSDSTAGDEFGWSVGISGNTAVIGAPFHAVGGNAMQGAAYVFGQQ